MIDGYPEHPTVTAGEPLVLRASTDAESFRVQLHRVGASVVPMGCSEWLGGHLAPPHLPWQDWGQDGEGLDGEVVPGWARYEIPIPSDWRPGIYLADFVERGQEGRNDEPASIDGRSGKALFVVRSPRPTATTLYKVPLFTYHAYNRVTPDGYDRATRRGGWSLYSIPPAADLPVAVPPSMSLRRPGGATGGTPSDTFNFDPFDPTPRQTFIHWDVHVVAWLERNGYPVDYCTDLDVHDDHDGSLLAGRRLLVSAGHDEYWTDAAREHVTRFRRGGGNVAFLGGNTCWYRITFDDDVSFRRAGEWSDPSGSDDPENSLTGVSYRNGGERDFDDHPIPVGYQVQHADHWVYEGTGLRDGSSFGDGRREYLVGYECDGAHFDRAVLERGGTVEPSGDDGTPPGFTILGVGDTSRSGWGLGNRAATTGTYTDGGTVFTAATTDWPRLLGAGHPAVDRITHNVVDRLR